MELARSDFVAIFRRQLDDGVVAPELRLSAAVPERIRDRLEARGLVFERLPGLLQRAVLWDAGLVLKGTGSGGEENLTLVQTWTRCGASMADIAIQPHEFPAASSSCRVEACSEATRSDSAFVSRCCGAATMLAVSKCAVASDAAAPPVSSGAIWSHESASDLEARVPSFAVYSHKTTGCDVRAGVDGGAAEDLGDTESPLYSIRTARREFGVEASSCPGSLVIPCVPLELARTHQPEQQWCLPRGEPLLEAWLRDYPSSAAASTAGMLSRLINSALVESAINAGPSVPVPSALHSLLGTTDGEHSIPLAADLARHYFRLHARGGSLPLKLEGGVPAEILARLEPFQISFHSLSGLLQRALIWDSGYALALDDHGKLQLVEISVKCGLRMADIALNAAYYLSTGCGVDDCSERNATSNATLYSLRAPKSCAIEQFEAVSLCAAAAGASMATSSKDESASLWATGSLNSASRETVPGMRVARRVANASVMYTIDTSDAAVDAGQCPAQPSITIPCVPYEKVALQSEWCRPVQSNLVAAWIRFEERQYMALINLIVLSSAVLLAVALDLFLDRKPRRIRSAAIGAATASIDSANMDVTEQSVQPSAVSARSTNRSSAAE